MSGFVHDASFAALHLFRPQLDAKRAYGNRGPRMCNRAVAFLAPGGSCLDMACIEHCAEIGRHVGRQRLSISFAKALADAMTLV